jgi:hypothetical protein
MMDDGIQTTEGKWGRGKSIDYLLFTIYYFVVAWSAGVGKLKETPTTRVVVK